MAAEADEKLLHACADVVIRFTQGFSGTIRATVFDSLLQSGTDTASITVTLNINFNLSLITAASSHPIFGSAHGKGRRDAPIRCALVAT